MKARLFFPLVSLFLLTSLLSLNLTLVGAQDPTPTPIAIPTLALDLGGGSGTAVDLPTRLANIVTINLKQSELPGGAFNVPNSNNGAYSVEQQAAIWATTYPDNPLVASLRAAYVNGGVVGVGLAEFYASQCGGLSVYGLGNWLRAMTDPASADGFIVDVTAPGLYERLFGWTSTPSTVLTDGNLYALEVGTLSACGARSAGYIYEYAYGAYVVGLTVYLPEGAALTNAESVLGQLATIMNGRIDAVEGQPEPRPTQIPVISATATPERVVLQAIPTLQSPGLAQAFVLQPDGLQSFNATGGITNPGVLIQNPADTSRYLITDALGLLFTMKNAAPARINVSPFNDFIPSTRDVNQDIVVDAAWSPDGQYVSFVMDTTGNVDQSRTPDDGVWFFQPELTWPIQYLISCPPGCGIVSRAGEPQTYKAVSSVWSPDSRYLLINLDLLDFQRGGFTVLEQTFNEAVRHVRPPISFYDHADWGIDGRIVVSGRAPGSDPQNPAESSRVILGTVNRDGSGEQVTLDASAQGLWLAYGTQRPQDDQPFAGELLALGKPGGADGPMYLYDQRGEQLTSLPIGQTRPAYVRWNADRTAVYVRTQEGRKFIAQINGEILEVTSAIGSVSAVYWPTGWQPPTAR